MTSVIQRPKRLINITGLKVGFLLVLGVHHKKGSRGHVVWDCLCKCGNLVQHAGTALRQGDYKSCGCERDNWGGTRFTHGAARRGAKAREYQIYLAAKNRCNNSTAYAYHRYGGRGIEFRFESYEQFLQELGPRPSSKHSLDRINNDGHYECGNVRWATVEQQHRNRTGIHWIEYNGERKMVRDWSRTLNIPEGRIFGRLRRKWCTECTFTLPPFGVCKHRAMGWLAEGK